MNNLAIRYLVFHICYFLSCYYCCYYIPCILQAVVSLPTIYLPNSMLSKSKICLLLFTSSALAMSKFVPCQRLIIQGIYLTQIIT